VGFREPPVKWRPVFLSENVVSEWVGEGGREGCGVVSGSWGWDREGRVGQIGE